MSGERAEICEVTVAPHPTQKKRLVISVDHQPWRLVDLFFFQNHQSSLEKCRTLGELENTFETIEVKQSRLFALRKITKQALPKKSLERSMTLRAITPTTIQNIIDDFEQRGYLNDNEWSRSFVRQQQAKKVGPRAIAQKLTLKGIAKEEIASALEQEATLGQQETIASLLATKYRRRDLTDYKERSKVVAALMRRGFDLDEILQTFRSRGKELEEE